MRATVGILTLGCKVNQYESEAIAEALVARGFVLSSPGEACDAYIINTCTVTAESDRKARQFIRRVRKQNPAAPVLVTGCLAQVNAASVASIEGVDFLCGNRNKMATVDALCALFANKQKNSTPVLCVPSTESAGFEEMTISHFGRTRAYIKIEDGCESHCTYCIIPRARGSICSKPAAAVLREAAALTENGCREIVLTGIETASWGKDLPGTDLADLLEAVCALPDIGRVRLGSLDPTLMRPAFVERIARLPALAPHFHLSMQSGSDAVLARMRRKYNRTQALVAVERLRAAIPDVQLTTDIIVGFPGETEQDFAATCDLVRRARFLMVHVFPYSKRAGTPAATMPDQIPGAVKHERVARLSALAAEVRRDILQGLCQARAEREVLFETDEDGLSVGHTPDFIEVCVPSPLPLHGTLRRVRLLSPEPDGLRCLAELL